MEKTDTTPLFSQIKSYAETWLRLLKLEAMEKGTAIAADVIADIVILICGVLAFILASVTAAFLIGVWLNATWLGFAAVTLLYLLIAVLVLTFKKGVERPLINLLIRKFFK